MPKTGVGAYDFPHFGTALVPSMSRALDASRGAVRTQSERDALFEP